MIRTTHRKAIEAYRALGHIWDVPFRLEDSRMLMLLRIELEKEAKFHDQEIQKQVGRYNPKPTESGGLQFDTAEDRMAFDKAVEDLNSMEIEIGADSVRISSSCDAKVSPSDLYALMGFVEIE